ncbi:MAG: leucyl aminopeptidase [Leptospiraceae bacterium]|nr:leucyl aminopeptidase [Leptospiraceae bacterium]
MAETTNKHLEGELAYPEHKFQILLEEKTPADLYTFDFIPAAENEENLPVAAFSFFKAGLNESVSSAKKTLIGVGKLEELDLEQWADVLSSTAGKIVKNFKEVKLNIPAIIFRRFKAGQVANLLATAFGNAGYPSELLKSKDPAEKIILQKLFVSVPSAKRLEFQTQLEKFLVIARHINAMRQTQVLPGNFLTPTTMEKRALQVGNQYPVKVTVFDERQLKEMGAGGILAVARGSEEEPRMLVLDYNPAGAKSTIALVGKGVTFDTGGISIKPSAEMHEMKYDMSGSGAALHAIAAIADLKLPVRAIGIVGMVENMPDGKAFKPGDVYRALNGLTIEVQNTDAEGRLVLGDLLTYAEKEYSPDLIINLATLTGACVVALGNYYAGLFSPSRKVIESVQKAAEQSLEPVWALPMGRVYREALKSEIADHNNIGGRYGGSSIAASFLSLFLEKPEKWAHLDIAGVGMLNKGYGVYPAHASGYGIRLLVQIAENLGAEKK